MTITQEEISALRAKLTDLVARLRECFLSATEGFIMMADTGAIYEEAAAAITRLTAELAEARAERDGARAMMGVGNLHAYQHSDARHLVKPRPGQPICEWAELELTALRSSLTAAESALLKLANAADVVGVAYFDTDTLEPPIQALHDATIAARAAIRTLPAERPGEPETEARS